MPALPAERHRRLGDHPQLADDGEVTIGGTQQPNVVRGQGQVRRETPAVFGEEQDRVRGLDDIQLAHVIPADQRDLNGAYRPGQRVGRLRGGLGGPDPLRAAAHHDRIAVGGHPPGGDPVGRLADGGQDHLDAHPVGVEGDPRARGRSARRDPASPRRRPIEALRRDFLARGLDDAYRKPDAVQVGIGIGQAVQQVQAAVDHVEGVVPAVGEEPPGGNVQLRQAQVPSRSRRPGQEALGVEPGVEPTAGQQQPEVVAQAVGGQAGVHQDRPDEVQRQVGERRHAQAVDRPVEGAPPDALVL